MLTTQDRWSSPYGDTFEECPKNGIESIFYFFNVRISRCGSVSVVAVVIHMYVSISLNVNF